MTIQVSTTDPRTARALELLSAADRWLKITSKANGRRYYAIPSSDGRHVYWTRPDACSCLDATRRGATCKHQIAAGLHVPRVNAERRGRAAQPAIPAASIPRHAGHGLASPRRQRAILRGVNVAIVAVAFLLPDAIRTMFRSATSRRHRLQFNLFLHSDIPEVRAACEELVREYPTVYFPHGTNRGLARTWNDAVLGAYGRGAGLVLIVNDDIVFSEGDLDKIVECAADNRDRFMVTCAGWNARENRRREHHAFSCFALNPIALEVLGCFDQNFAPAYFEDLDYVRRAELTGLREEWCTQTDVLHAGSGSCYLTPETAQAAAEAHYTNSMYMRRKWGVPDEVHIADWQGHCRYERPFDNPAFGLRIAPENRHAPYGPGFDREERGVE